MKGDFDMKSETKDKVTFSLDKVSLEHLDQMRGITPRSTYLNFIIDEYFRIKQDSERIHKVFDALVATHPATVARLLGDGIKVADEFSDAEVNEIKALVETGKSDR